MTGRRARSARSAWGRAAVSAAVGLSFALAVAPPVSASTSEPLDRLTYSHDGDVFVTGGDVALFAGVVDIVPGDSASDTVWFRNDAPEPGRLAMGLIGADADDAALADAMSLTFVDGSGQRLNRVTIADAAEAGDCAALSGGRVLQPGEVLEVDITLLIDEELGSQTSAGDPGSGGVVRFQLRAALTEASAPATGTEACPVTANEAAPGSAPKRPGTADPGADVPAGFGADGPGDRDAGGPPAKGSAAADGAADGTDGDELPFTGGPVGAWVIVVAVLAIVSGTLLLPRARRRGRFAAPPSPGGAE